MVRYVNFLCISVYVITLYNVTFFRKLNLIVNIRGFARVRIYIFVRFRIIASAMSAVGASGLL